MARKVFRATHRAVLATGETIDYYGAHPTHWTFGGVDADGKRDGSKVRKVAVVDRYPLTSVAGYEDDDGE